MIKQKVLLKNETTYRFGGACKNFFLLEDKNDLNNFSEFDTFSKYFILGKYDLTILNVSSVDPSSTTMISLGAKL